MARRRTVFEELAAWLRRHPVEIAISSFGAGAAVALKASEVANRPPPPPPALPLPDGSELVQRCTAHDARGRQCSLDVEHVTHNLPHRF